MKTEQLNKLHFFSKKVLYKLLVLIVLLVYSLTLQSSIKILYLLFFLLIVNFQIEQFYGSYNYQNGQIVSINNRNYEKSIIKGLFCF